MSEVIKKNYEISIKNREAVTASGVKNVESFGEDYLTLATDLGELVVEGKNLKIESLTKENGEIYIIGEIEGLFYKVPKIQKGFFSKLFK